MPPQAPKRCDGALAGRPIILCAQGQAASSRKGARGVFPGRQEQAADLHANRPSMRPLQGRSFIPIMRFSVRACFFETSEVVGLAFGMEFMNMNLMRPNISRPSNSGAQFTPPPLPSIFLRLFYYFLFFIHCQIACVVKQDYGIKKKIAQEKENAMA